MCCVRVLPLLSCCAMCGVVSPGLPPCSACSRPWGAPCCSSLVCPGARAPACRPTPCAAPPRPRPCHARPHHIQSDESSTISICLRDTWIEATASIPLSAHYHDSLSAKTQGIVCLPGIRLSRAAGGGAATPRCQRCPCTALHLYCASGFPHHRSYIKALSLWEAVRAMR